MLRITTPPASATDTAADTRTPSVSTANELLSAGRLAEAYPLLQRIAESHQDNLTILTTTALTAIQLNRLDDGRHWFERAAQAHPDDYDTVYNLVLLDSTQGRWRDALARLHHLRRLRPQSSKLLNDIAIVWSNRSHQGRALAAFSRALRLDPNDSETRNNAMQFCLEQQVLRQALRLLQRQESQGGLTAKSKAEVHRWREIIESAVTSSTDSTATGAPESAPIMKRPVLRGQKIVVFASQRTFLKDTIETIEADNDVRAFDGGTIERMAELMRWADVAWFEWCDSFIIQATALPKTCKIICRLHSYEAFTDMPSKVDWSKVDRLVFVNRSVEQVFRQQVKADVPTSIVFNGVDLERFSMPIDKRPSKRIASVGYINYKKNPALLLYCFKKIYEYDPEYTLHIAGSHQDARIQLYFQHFLSRHPLPVHFDDWVEDIPTWFRDKGYVISTSLFESFHYSIAEGMASGVMPLIHDWYGADNLYPRDYFFSDPDDCLRLLKHLESCDQTQLRSLNREHIARRFDAKERMAELVSIMQSVIESAPAGPVVAKGI